LKSLTGFSPVGNLMVDDQSSAGNERQAVTAKAVDSAAQQKARSIESSLGRRIEICQCRDYKLPESQLPWVEHVIDESRPIPEVSRWLEAKSCPL